MDDTAQATARNTGVQCVRLGKIGGFPRVVMPVFAPAARRRFTLEISPGIIAALKGPFSGGPKALALSRLLLRAQSRRHLRPPAFMLLLTVGYT